MTSGSPNVLRRLVHRATRTTADLEYDSLRQASTAQGGVHIRNLEPRTIATVVGEVRSVTLRPRADVPALVVELFDGSDALQLVWLGRRRIPGVVPGVRLQATGRVTRHRQMTTIYNPAYEIRGGPEVAHA
jgi:RecG-like helicase